MDKSFSLRVMCAAETSLKQKKAARGCLKGLKAGEKGLIVGELKGEEWESSDFGACFRAPSTPFQPRT